MPLRCKNLVLQLVNYKGRSYQKMGHRKVVAGGLKKIDYFLSADVERGNVNGTFFQRNFGAQNE
jgi:hypothetical protein